MIIIQVWKIDAYTIKRYRDNHGRDLFAFQLKEGDQIRDHYDSLDMALIAMISTKYTGHRGASGENVGTAADWFARMIGMPAPSGSE